MWVIVLLYDGPVRMTVYGDETGRPFTAEGSAEAYADLARSRIRRAGARCSVYVVQMKAVGTDSN